MTRVSLVKPENFWGLFFFSLFSFVYAFCILASFLLLKHYLVDASIFTWSDRQLHTVSTPHGDVVGWVGHTYPNLISTCPLRRSPDEAIIKVRLVRSYLPFHKRIQ